MAINQSFIIPDAGIYVNGTATFTSSMSVNGAITTPGNVVVSNSTLFSNVGIATAQFGNATFYSQLNQTSVSITNTTFASTFTPNSLTVGNSTLSFTANNSQIKVGTSGVFTTINATAANVGGVLSVVGTATFGNDVTVQGNLLINGTTTTIHAQNLNVDDNIITLISNASGTPLLNAGFEVNRGSSANVSYIWDETNKYFTTGTSALYVGGNTTLNGNATLNGDISIVGNTTLGSAAVDSVTIRANTVTVISNASFNTGLLYLDTFNNRIGVGTSTPAYKLSVVGDISATGNAVVTGSVNTGSFTVGTLFTANSTLTNTAAINVTGQVNTGTLYATTSANVGGNVQITTAGLTVGNTTVNTAITSAQYLVQNSTSSVTISPSSVIATQVNTASFFATTSANVGGNVYITTSSLFIGNTTANVTLNSSLFGVQNTTSNVTISPTTITIGNSTVSATVNSSLYTGTASNAALFNALGATAYVSNSALQSYNLVNTSASYTLAGVFAYTANVTLGGGSLSQLVINSTAVVANTLGFFTTGKVNTATFFASTTANVGANVLLTTSTITIGNTISNVQSNSTQIVVASGVSNTVVTSDVITIGSGTQYATINSTAYTGNANSATYLAGAGATAFVSNSALQGYWISPPIIGGTTPNTGNFTNTNISGNAYLTVNSRYVFGTLTDGVTQVRMMGINTANSVYLGSLDNGPSLIRVNAPSNAPVYVYTNSAFHTSFAANGNLGINTSAPAYQLDVNGDTRVVGTVNAVAFNIGTTVIANTLGTYATQLGGFGATSFVSNSALQGYGFTNATNLATGTVPTARLGTGTANSTSYLAGDQSWKVINSSITINNGTGITGGGTGQSFTLSLVSGVATPGSSTGGISAITVDTYGRVTSVTGSAGYLTSVPNASTQVTSLGVGVAASGTAGEIRATNEITAYYSSDRTLKENIAPIENALDKLSKISGVMFDWTDEYIEARGGEDGYFVRKHDTGIIAQEVQQVLPEVVAERDDGTLAVKYEKMMGLVIQAINELAIQVDEIKQKVS